jgi:hypothetical protein
MVASDFSAIRTMRRGTAIHEAGHAVVMWALGLTVSTIEIGIDADETKGRADLLTSDEHLPLIDRVAICYAGIEAQYVFDCPPHELAGMLDHAKVAELLEDISEPRAKQIREAGFDRARALVLMHKANLLRVAERLVENGKVTTDEFATLVSNV